MKPSSHATFTESLYTAVLNSKDKAKYTRWSGFVTSVLSCPTKTESKILTGLLVKPSNLTGISKTLDLKTQESSRHLQRLLDAKLLLKDSEGVFSVSPFGRIILELQKSLRFVSSNRGYFNTHSLESLPEGFAGRIAELSQSRYTPDVMNSFAWVESLFKSAEEYVWMVHDQYIVSTLPSYLGAIKKGLRFKLVELFGRAPERRLDQMRTLYISDEDEETILNARLSGQVESYYLDKIDVFLYKTEKTCLIAFPKLEGTFDYLGFMSQDRAAHRFCQDLFETHLEKAQKITSEELIENHETRMRIRGSRETEQSRQQRRL